MQSQQFARRRGGRGHDRTSTKCQKTLTSRTYTAFRSQLWLFPQYASYCHGNSKSPLWVIHTWIFDHWIRRELMSIPGLSRVSVPLLEQQEPVNGHLDSTDLRDPWQSWSGPSSHTQRGVICGLAGDIKLSSSTFVNSCKDFTPPGSQPTCQVSDP